MIKRSHSWYPATYILQRDAGLEKQWKQGPLISSIFECQG